MAEINSDRIVFKVATAFAKLIEKNARNDLAELQIIPGQTNVQRNAERVEVVCESADMEQLGGIYTGNYWANVHINLVTHRSDALRADVEAMFGQIREIVMVDDLVTQVNSLDLPDFSLLGNPGELATTLDQVKEGFVQVGDAFEDIFGFRAYCCPSTIEGVTP